MLNRHQFKPRFKYDSFKYYLDRDWEEEFRNTNNSDEKWDIVSNHLKFAREKWMHLQKTNREIRENFFSTKSADIGKTKKTPKLAAIH